MPNQLFYSHKKGDFLLTNLYILGLLIVQLHLYLEASVLKPHLHFDFYLETKIK